MNDCGHAGSGELADMGDGRRRRLCESCRAKLVPVRPNLPLKYMTGELEGLSVACPPCPKCGIKAGSRMDHPRGMADDELACLACGHEWKATAAELEQARIADEAYELMQEEGGA